LIGWAIWQSKRETGPVNVVSPETGGSPVTAK